MAQCDRGHVSFKRGSGVIEAWTRGVFEFWSGVFQAWVRDKNSFVAWGGGHGGHGDEGFRGTTGLDVHQC